MNIAICQLDTAWMDQESNLRKIGTFADGIEGKADFLFLPEMFNTGYTMTPGDIPGSWQEECVTGLQRISASCGCWIAGSIPYLHESRWTNRLLVIGPQGIEAHYDKSHLFTPAGESESYESGKETIVVHKGNWCIRPLVCYDLRFPYLSFRSPEADILFYSANWPATRIHHWHALLKARAIENLCYVIAVNRTGSDPNGYQYSGQSVVISFSGEVIRILDVEEACATVTLDKAALEEYRKKLPFIADRKII